MSYQQIQLQRVSVTDPLNDAWRVMKRVLFEPFNMEKWFMIGFCAWLASFGSGGSGGNANFGGGEELGNMHDLQQQAIQYMPIIITVGSIIVLVCLAIGLLCLWLNSRGKFMFLDCIVRNYGGVKTPWKEYKHDGNSLFVFKAIMGILGFVCILVTIGLIALLVVLLSHASEGEANIAAIILLLVGVTVSATIALSFFIVHQFTNDFVVPIMYIYRIKCTEAWGHLWRLINDGNVWRFVWYHIFKGLLMLAVAILYIFAIIATCCIAGCIMAIPYIGAVATLPVSVFIRAYSFCYLRQYGQQFDVYSVLATPEPDPQTSDHTEIATDTVTDAQFETEPEPKPEDETDI